MKLFDKLFSRGEKKELTPTQQKVRIALNWTVNVLCVVLIIFALVVAIFTIIRSTNPDNITRVGDNCYFNVISDSMKPTFTKADVIIAKAYDGDGSDLKVGQVITYKFVYYENGVGYDRFNSHRLIAIEEANGTKVFRTRGDNQEGSWKEALNDSTSWDNRMITAKDIVATWGDVDDELNFTNGKMLKGCGALGNFMQDPVEGKTRFFCLIVLPLLLLFVIYAFILVRTLIIAKLEKEKKVAGETAISVDAMTEEEKNALIAQLLASQNKSADAEETAETPTEDGAENNTEVKDGETVEPITQEVAENAESAPEVENADQDVETDKTENDGAEVAENATDDVAPENDETEENVAEEGTESVEDAHEVEVQGEEAEESASEEVADSATEGDIQSEEIAEDAE